MDSHPHLQPSPAGMTVVEGGLTRGSAPTAGVSPSPQPSPVKGEGVWEPGSGRTRGSAPTAGVSPSPRPSPVKGEGVRAPFHARLFSCVVGLRSPGWRAAGGGGVDGSCPGVRLVPVLFEFFLDSTLGDGELRGGGFFVLFLLYALGPQGLSASGGPGVSVPACREGF